MAFLNAGLVLSERLVQAAGCYTITLQVVYILLELASLQALH